MDLEKYPVTVNPYVESFSYHFESEGPKGTIPKIVQFTALQYPLYNLAFGDYCPILKKLDDQAVSGNADREKVLATVANCVVDFSRQFPERMIFATGSTPARTRLYQMGIARHLSEIEKEFDIFGELEGTWEKFETKVNYDAFLLTRKFPTFTYKYL